MIKAFIVISKKQHFIVFCLQWFSNILVEGRQQKTKNKNIEARSPALQADSLLSEPPGKLKNMEVGSLSLLQGVFPTQESNQGLLHCRQILYQLSYQESLPYVTGGKAIWNIALARTFSNSFLPTGTSYMSRDQEELICKSLEKEVVALNIHISKIQV